MAPGHDDDDEDDEDDKITLRQYLMSIVFMPRSMQILCLTNLLSWMAHLSYSLYFTDFVGEAVFGGDPTVSGKHYYCIIYATFLSNVKTL